MNPPDGDGASRSGQETSSNNNKPAGDDRMKRAAAKRLIERYFYQLLEGCGNPTCDNEHCKSSGEIKNLTPNQAAAQAIQLFSQEARLCERHPTKVARTNNDTALEASSCSDKVKSMDLQAEDAAFEAISNDKVMGEPSSKQKTCSSMQEDDDKSVPYLTADKLLDIINTCKETNCYALLIRTLGEVFSRIDSLSRSFNCTKSLSPIDEMLEKTQGDLSNLKKEDVRSLEGEQDKDEDCKEEGEAGGSSHSSRPHLDLCEVRRCYAELFKLPNCIFEGALVNALITLAGHLQMDLQMRRAKQQDIINVLLIVFEIPVLGNGDYLEMALPVLCKAVHWLPIKTQAKLAKFWAGPGRPAIRSILENLQQLVTLRVIVTQFHNDFYVQDEIVITAATKLMKVLFYANMMAGVMESPTLRTEETTEYQDDTFSASYENYKLGKTFFYEDKLGKRLGIHPLDCRKPYLPFSEFYNEPLSDCVEMDRDFANYKGDSAGLTGKFSFMNYAFILTPATKAMGLYFDSRIRMYSERRNNMIQSVAIGELPNPYLKLRVRRDHIIDDALVELEVIAMGNPIDLKKQLVVEFIGEQGIDEGGVSKEFFQLVIEEIFNPDYGMFTQQENSQNFWFNPMSFESDAQFTLVGIVLGLAIYNNIILAVNFPMVVYQKLMGKRGSLEDLQDWNQTLYRSLKDMLEYSQPDFQDVFMQTFKVSYQDVFGNVINHELEENGDQIPVTQENKKEFVESYADFLLNKSVEKQFRAFHRGFQMVTDESPLGLLFRPEEVELLVCGSKNFDFDELEGATEYENGYTRETPVIKHFWSVVHSLSADEQRKLLHFTTGSDRVPPGGLSKLKLVIARHGPDTDRLPTAHTCFNVLLLPEYSSREKLQDRLVKAISYSKGFGMA